ncbi:polygalacturonase-like [Salvia miltiorrhiza]|uniref:polygalacturonase-like n=1 Tax=Salvia miltiorrhiza TaxID=226208 RepID=UPI0025AC84F8|nr:polygalacturonase-like [Salvia miltiorrhiza]
MPKLATFTKPFFIVLIATLLHTCIAKSYNVVDFGAKANGKTDSSPAFMKAWAAACSSNEDSTVLVPSGTFMSNSVSFNGTCKKEMRLQILGNIVAPSYESLSDHQVWIGFYFVSRLSIIGGTIDAKGSSYWSCKRSKKDCPYGARSIALQSCKHVLVSGLKSFNSEGVHLHLNGCNNVTMQNLTLTAPGDSPNTDGIHIGNSDLVRVLHSTIGTGDDCISIGPGSTNMWVDNVAYGPGHGISIGSIGGTPKEAGVEHIVVNNSVFTDTDNGVRIKSWAKPSDAYVKDIKFENLRMQNVANPIIIDQEYCPARNCSKASSGVKISDVKFNNITGTSSTVEALILDCSLTNPCEKITLQNINLVYADKMKKVTTPATSRCQNAQVIKAGVVNPSC